MTTIATRRQCQGLRELGDDTVQCENAAEWSVDGIHACSECIATFCRDEGATVVVAIEDGAIAGSAAGENLRLSDDPYQSGLLNPAPQVYFRAGLIACREYMARFVESSDPVIAASIRANWWPRLGEDLGRPRQIAWGELTAGEFGTEGFRIKTTAEISPTLEALPIAAHFLGDGATVPVGESTSPALPTVQPRGEDIAGLRRQLEVAIESREMVEKATVHRCKECGMLWRKWGGDGGWSLLNTDQKPGKCCDNVAMDEQIEEIDLAKGYQRLHALINTPLTDDFLQAVTVEAAHQVERWGAEHDDGKTDADWFWLLGYLGTKALLNPGDDHEKKLHRIITVGAAAFNWWKRTRGIDLRMRPGIAEPTAAEVTPAQEASGS